MSGTATRLTMGAIARGISGVLGAAVGFLMMPFLVSHLGDRWYGIWTAVGSLVGSYFLLDFGLSAAVTRFVTEAIAREQWERASAVVSTAFALYSALALVIVGMTFGAAYFAEHFIQEPGEIRTVRLLIVMAGLSLAFGFPFKSMAGLIQSRLRYDLLAWWNTALTLFLAVLTYVFVRIGWGVMGLAVVAVLGALLSDLIFVVLSRKLCPEIRIQRRLMSRAIVGDLFTFSSWAFVINLADQVRTRIYALVVGSLHGAAAVTRFSVGARLAETAIGFLYTSTAVVQPVLTAYVARGERERFRDALVFFSKINASIGLFVFAMLLILGRPFLTVWMGPEHADAAYILYLLSAGMAVTFIVYPLDNSLYAVRKHRFLAITNVVDAAVNLALSIALGIRLGLIGVAIGAMLPTVVSRLGFVVPYACKQSGVGLGHYLAAIFRCLLVGAAVMLPAWALYDWWPAEPGYLSFLAFVAIVGAVYWPLAFMLMFNGTERAHLLSVVRKKYAAAPAS